MSTTIPSCMTEGFVSFERIDALGVKRPEDTWDVGFLIRVLGINTANRLPFDDLHDYGPWSIEENGIRFSYRSAK